MSQRSRAELNGSIKTQTLQTLFTGSRRPGVTAMPGVILCQFWGRQLCRAKQHAGVIVACSGGRFTTRDTAAWCCCSIGCGIGDHLLQRCRCTGWRRARRPARACSAPQRAPTWPAHCRSRPGRCRRRPRSALTRWRHHKNICAVVMQPHAVHSVE